MATEQTYAQRWTGASGRAVGRHTVLPTCLVAQQFAGGTGAKLSRKHHHVQVGVARGASHVAVSHAEAKLKDGIGKGIGVLLISCNLE